MSPTHPIQKIEDLECYLVGGAVRDKLLGLKRYDQDWVVVGASPEIMHSLGFKRVGRKFPVFLHPKTYDEYALARREQKSGVGYKGFTVDCSSDVSLEEDLLRRDLTVNAMAMTSDGIIIDPYGGRSDLKNRTLRHVSKHFVDDPLRVLRVARFAARYRSKGFEVHSSTLELMKSIVSSDELLHLTAERIWMEVRSALSEKNPSTFFRILHSVGAIKQIFPELLVLNFDEQSSNTYSDIRALDRSAQFTELKEYRFAVLTYCLSSTINQNTQHLVLRRSKPEWMGGVGMVRIFCDRLKVSAKFRDLAINVSLHTDKFQFFDQLSANEVVDLVRQLKGLNTEVEFLNVVNACKVVLYSTQADSNKVDLAVNALLSSREKILAINQAALSKQYRGKKLGAEIKKAQVLAVREFLNSHML